jgi:6-phosphofructokinase 1
LPVGDAFQTDELDLSDDDILTLKSIRPKLERRDSPFVPTNNSGGGFVGDRDLCLLNTMVYESPDSSGSSCQGGIYNQEEGVCIPLPPYAIRSGPRHDIYFDPDKVTAAIVTCGGLCPGLNDVVQNIVYTLADYGVPLDQIFGIKYGLRGFYDRATKPVHLTPEVVDGIQLRGGTILGTSRGGADVTEIVKRLKLWGVNQLYVVGGNGGNAAANAIQKECEVQGVIASVVGIPKSIDNDILLIDKCFGFETSVERSQTALMAAKVEARSTRRGIGLVKLMGRSSGFIAMQASMASGVWTSASSRRCPSHWRSCWRTSTRSWTPRGTAWCAWRRAPARTLRRFQHCASVFSSGHGGRGWPCADGRERQPHLEGHRALPARRLPQGTGL